MKLTLKHHLAALTAIAVLCSATFTGAAEKKDIVDTAVGAGSFKTLAAALGAADLDRLLSSLSGALDAGSRLDEGL